jgi:pimeloyl-ACP methyl ester carboxylesterase
VEITTRGATLHVQQYGEGGEAVLLLHGALADNLQNWRMVHEPLAKKHRVVGLDLRGHGKSTNPTGEFTLDALRQDAIDVLDALGLERVHVLGASLGGYVGLALRYYHPERVASLATCGSKIGWDAATAADRAAFFEPANILKAHPLWAPHLAKAHGSHYGPEHWKTIVRWVNELLQTLPQEPAVQYEALEKDTFPFLYALGDHDDLAHLPEVLAVRKHRPDAAIMVAPEAGHLFREYNQEAFAACYLDFLRRAIRRAG